MRESKTAKVEAQPGHASTSQRGAANCQGSCAPRQDSQDEEADMRKVPNSSQSEHWQVPSLPSDDWRRRAKENGREARQLRSRPATDPARHDWQTG